MKEIKFESLVGKVFTSIDVEEDIIRFHLDTGDTVEMFHEQDCCECVTVEDVCGNIADLIETPIVSAEETTNSDRHPSDIDKKCDDYSFTWTFYRIATRKGSVVIRWYGESNGCYSESVSLFRKTKRKKEQ
jgi:hypothetical protein